MAYVSKINHCYRLHQKYSGCLIIIVMLRYMVLRLFFSSVHTLLYFFKSRSNDSSRLNNDACMRVNLMVGRNYGKEMTDFSAPIKYGF